MEMSLYAVLQDFMNWVSSFDFSSLISLMLLLFSTSAVFRIVIRCFSLSDVCGFSFSKAKEKQTEELYLESSDPEETISEPIIRSLGAWEILHDVAEVNQFYKE